MARHLTWCLVALALFVSAGCAETDEPDAGASADNSSETTVVDTTTETPPPETTPLETAPPETVATTPPTPPPVSAVMPNIPCGTDLQLAQDTVQESGVFYSESRDATGQGRNQVLDRNWTVVGADLPAGSPIDETNVGFYVVKDEEYSGDCL